MDQFVCASFFSHPLLACTGSGHVNVRYRKYRRRCGHDRAHKYKIKIFITEILIRPGLITKQKSRQISLSLCTLYQYVLEPKTISQVWKTVYHNLCVPRFSQHIQIKEPTEYLHLNCLDYSVVVFFQGSLLWTAPCHLTPPCG